MTATPVSRRRRSSSSGVGWSDISAPHPPRVSVCVVGPGFRFLSGLSVYTCRLANALAEDLDVSVILLDRLIPARLYPGGARVGQDLSSLSYSPAVTVGPSVDWYWGTGLAHALRFLRRTRPQLLVLQWWTAATLHTYLALALAARRLGIRVVLELHELQDTGEAAIPLVGPYRAGLMPQLLRLASGAVVHTDHDLEMLRGEYAGQLDHLHIEVAPHGPYDHLQAPDASAPGATRGPDDVTRLLFFGLIRPYKGLEDLLEAFDGLDAATAARFHLTVVGETWEGWTRPAQMIAASPHPQQVTFVNEYVTDKAAGAFFADADVVVLPYRRGSASGPLQIAMSHGLHVVLYAVGGLVEAVRDYAGATLVPPDDVAALRAALLAVEPRRAERFDDPHSWGVTTLALRRLAAPTGRQPDLTS